MDEEFTRDGTLLGIAELILVHNVLICITHAKSPKSLKTPECSGSVSALDFETKFGKDFHDIIKASFFY